MKANEGHENLQNDLYCYTERHLGSFKVSLSTKCSTKDNVLSAKLETLFTVTIS